jgi:hypothetical protein
MASSSVSGFSPSQHPFLTPTRAGNVSSWTLSIPGRGSYPSANSGPDDQSREAAIEAYRQLKAAIFSKAIDSNLPKPT